MELLVAEGTSRNAPGSMAVALGPAIAPRLASTAAGVALRSALQARLQRRSTDEALRRALRLVGDEARRCGMPVEQLLVVVKRALASVVDAEVSRFRPAVAELRQHVVTTCIEQYFGCSRCA